MGAGDTCKGGVNRHDHVVATHSGCPGPYKDVAHALAPQLRFEAGVASIQDQTP
jgi:hypothetical protein